LLRLVFYTQDIRLKVRQAFPEDDFSSSCHWKNKLDFIVTDSGDFTMVWTSLLPDLEPEYAEALVDLVGARYSVSNDYSFLNKTCPAITFKNPTDEWIFYGGTFNPWHRGHQACLDLLPEDKVCLILPDRNPQKENRNVNAVSTILEISNKAKFRKNQFLVPTFLIQKNLNPTVTWVESFQDQFPTSKISLLLGFDSFARMKTWVRPEDLLPKLHAIYVVSRLEDDEDRRLALDEVHALGSNMNIIFLGKHDYENVSSTELRRKMNP
jgi:nicotinate (nicotinamide) nucleotide adenylyltransferase